jgi:hypothetical protein
MVGELRRGPASMAGLEWLVRVGPAPTDAIAAAMGWGDRVARLAPLMGTSVLMIERHYGTLLDDATAGIANRLNAFDLDQDQTIQHVWPL